MNALAYYQERSIVTPAGCWEWQLHRGPKGYGRVKRKGVLTREAHRAAYTELVGPIAPGLDIDHLCRNPPCINPAHLQPVTRRTNILRGVGSGARHAMAVRCPSGHPYDDANTYRWRGGRACRICRGNQSILKRLRRRAERARRTLYSDSAVVQPHREGDSSPDQTRAV